MSSVGQQALTVLCRCLELGGPFGESVRRLRADGLAVTPRGVGLARYHLREAGTYLGLPTGAAWSGPQWRAAAGVALIDLALRLAEDAAATPAAGRPLTRVK